MKMSYSSFKFQFSCYAFSGEFSCVVVDEKGIYIKDFIKKKVTKIVTKKKKKVDSERGKEKLKTKAKGDFM